MPETFKPIAQSAPAATTLIALFTVPGATAVVVSKLVVCNQGAAGSFRVAISPLGAAVAQAHYAYYDAPLGANDTAEILSGITLQPTDVVRVYASHGNFSFGLYGSLIT